MEALSSCLVTSTSFLSTSLSSTPLKASPYATSVKPLGQGTPIKHQPYEGHKQSKNVVTPPCEGPRYNMKMTLSVYIVQCVECTFIKMYCFMKV